jgi:PAS domain S-box-containing protein
MNYSDKNKDELLKHLDELQQAYDELSIKEERYRLLAENARDVIWNMKLDGTITYISPAVEDLRGFTVEEAMQQPLHEILTPESQAVVMNYFYKLHTAYQAGLPLESFKGENEYYCKDGSTLITEVTVYPIYGRDGKTVTLFGVTRDITERKKFEAQLLDQTNKLKELNATKDKFFSIIAHDLRSPFNGILGFSELLIREAHNIDIEMIVKYSSLIHSTAQETYNLLETLLDWARTQQNIFPFKPRKLLLNYLIKDEIEQIKHYAVKKNITIVDNTSGDIILTADQNMLETVMRNLISNAIKFTQKNGFVSVEAVAKSDQIEISVIDTGIGMSSETIEKLFKIESDFSSRGTDNEKGSGLGLLLCKEFVEKHGGNISVTSKIGKGSKFQISIPLDIPETDLSEDV